jgi:2-polyprenyl-6-methoxyphenol hydroxylase-like FAD-dependent oxidoreductase
MSGRALVAGAGIGGLAAAIALSRQGWEVVLVERDDTPMPDDVEGAFAWDRRGAPQVRHSHGFPALLRMLLRDRFPDVLRALRDAGVAEVAILPPTIPPETPGYAQHAEDLQVLSCRRTTLEWVLRRCALAEPEVRLRVGAAVAGLLAGPRSAGAPLDVRGARLDDGTELDADLVVAATGRRDGLPSWFAAHGVHVPEEEHPTGTIYLSRFYRADPAVAPVGFRGGRRDGIGVVLAGADQGTYSATLAIDRGDAELRAHLLDPEHFEAALPLFPELAPAVQAGGMPITGVNTMGGLVNRLRRYVDDDGMPLALGFAAIGDAHTCTNPLYGRGSSLAVLQAVLLADAVAAHAGDRDAAARAYETASATRVEPWYHVSLETDRAAAGHAGDAPPRLDMGVLRRVLLSGDPELSLVAIRTMSLLASPDEVFGDPDIARRLASVAAAVEQARDPNRPRRPPITREALLGLRSG